MSLFDSLAPKIFGLIVMAILFYEEYRKKRLIRNGPTAKGTILKVEKNQDVASRLNRVAFIEFSYKGQQVIIKHFFSSTSDNEPKDLLVYVDEKKLDRSVVGKPSKYFITWGMVIAIIFSILIIISFFRKFF